MAVISRRRKFIILVIICCASFAMFGWYTRMEDGITLNESLMTVSYDSKNLELVDSNNMGRSNSVKKYRNKIDYFQSERFQLKTTHKEPENANDLSVSSQKIEKNSITLPDTDNLSDLKVKDEALITDTVRRQTEMEMESTGPTTHAEKEATTTRPHTEMEMELTGPTQFTIMETTTPNLLPEQNKEKSVNEVLADTSSERLTGEEYYSTTSSGNQVTKHDSGAGLLLDTPGCKVPLLDPWDPTVIKLFEKQTPYECPGPPLFMKSQPDGSISVNETVLQVHYKLKPSQITCSYQSFRRKHEDPGNVRENDYIVGEFTELKFNVPLNEDYVGVKCKLGKRKKTFEQYFPLVRLKKEIEDERSSIPPPTPRLNVILAGIDSISKLNFLRHFTRTKAFLDEKMAPFEMKGYTKVGDNTFPNLVPMLTGQFVEYYWNETVRDTFYFDELDLIWKDYAKKGYRTFYAEDSPLTGTFNYIKRGFYDPPTDYYLRPLALALDNSHLRTVSKSHCLNSQIETDIIYDYLRDFIKAMDSRPYIGFAMVSTITHDYLNNAGWADEPAARLLEDLWNSGALNSSVLVLFSDHGLRFGAIRQTYIGKFEERMPFMYIHFPKWFLDQYPDFAKNLRTNQERLITLFDIHATMIHLLDLSREMTPEEEAKVTRGSSLLNEISPNRTCEEANILAHWCPCQTFEAIPLTETAALKSSQSVVDDINRQLQPYSESCSVLEIDKILDVRFGHANDLVLRFIRHDNVVVNRKVVLGDKIEPIGDYLVTLITKPGGAVFEGTVRHDPNIDSYSILGISRINMYGNQSRCIDSQRMKIFCYCNS